jgi:putative peptide zinc metalloprotease protein
MHNTSSNSSKVAEIRLKGTVILVARGEHIALLDSASLAPALRLPAQASVYLNQLRVGIGRDADGALLRLAERLRRYGLIDGSEMDREVAHAVFHGKIYLANPDGLAQIFAKLVRQVPPALLQLVLNAIFVLAVGAVALQIWQWLSKAETLQFSLIGLITYCGIGVPLHEFCHATACRFAGASVSGMGIQFRSRSFPTPFINTRNLLLVRSHRLRAAVCLAGPFFDLILAGAASIPTGALVGPFFSTMCACAVFFLAMNLNPFRPSDGSNALKEFSTDCEGQVHPISPGKRLALNVTYVALFTIVILAFVSQFTRLLSAYLLTR